MNLSEEIQKLKELHDSGALTDDEFAQAKAKLMGVGMEGDKSAEESEKTPEPPDNQEEVETVVHSKGGGFNWAYLAGALLLVIGLIFIFSGKDNKSNERDGEGDRAGTKVSPISEAPKDITVAIDFELFRPESDKLMKILSKNKSLLFRLSESYSGDLGFYDGFTLASTYSSAYVIVRVRGSAKAYSDGVRINTYLGRKVSFSAVIPRKYRGRKMIVEIWNDDSKNKTAVQTFFESISNAKASGEIGGQASIKSPSIPGTPTGDASVYGKASGSMEFDFQNFSKLFHNKDDLVTAGEFTLEPGPEMERQALFLPAQYNKTGLGGLNRMANNIEKVLQEAVSKKILIKELNTYYYPMGKISIEIFED